MTLGVSTAMAPLDIVDYQHVNSGEKYVLLSVP
jgi:hypothetical protein